MGKMPRSLLLLGLTSFLAVQIQLVRAEPPVTNYMSNYYDPMFHDDGSLRQSPGHQYQLPSSRGYHTSGDAGGYEDHNSPYHHSSEEKGHSGYVSSSSLADDDDHHYDIPPTKGYGGSYSKGHHSSARGRSPSYGSYRPSKKGYSAVRPSSSYGSPYSSGKSSKGSRPVKYGGPEDYSSGSYPYGKGSPSASPYTYSEEHNHASHEDEPPRPTQSSYKGSSSAGYSPNSNGYKTVEEYPGGYIPSSGYQPDGWYNTMKGGYDDYGYNDHNPKTAGYKGPAYGKMYSPYSAPSLSEHGSKDTYSYGPPEYSSSSLYVESHDDEESKGPSSYSSAPYNSKDVRRPKPSNGYGQNPYLTNPNKGSSVKSSYGPPKVTYSYGSSPSKLSYGPPKKQYSSGKSSSSSSYGGRPSSYGKGSSYEGYGPPSKYSSSGNGDFSNYYRTRSGGFARKPQIMRSMTGFKYKYSTIGKPNSPHIKARHELENGHSEDYGPYNWENDGWTVAH